MVKKSEFMKKVEKSQYSKNLRDILNARPPSNNEKEVKDNLKVFKAIAKLNAHWLKRLL